MSRKTEQTSLNESNWIAERWHSWRLGCLALGLLSGASTTAAVLPLFSLTELPFLPSGYETIPYKINNAGTIVGSASRTSPQCVCPFVYSNSVFFLPPMRSDWGYAFDINNSGDFLVFATVDPFTPPHFLFFGADDGHLQSGYDLTAAAGATLGGWQGGYFSAGGLNDWGHVAGTFHRISDNSYSACVLSNGYFYYVSPAAEGERHSAMDINNLGQVLGTIWQAPVAPRYAPTGRPVIFDGGDVDYLGLLPGSIAGTGTALNDRREAIGYCYFPDDSVRSFFFAEGVMREVPPFPGGFSIRLEDLNNLGDVVGYGYGGSSTTRGFLYTSGVMYELNDLVRPRSRFRIAGANSINDRGEIVGIGIDERDGSRHGILLSPQGLWKRHYSRPAGPNK